MTPTFVVDGDHAQRVKRADDPDRVHGVERKTDRSGDPETCTADMQDGSADFASLGDLLDAVEPDCVAGDVQRTVLLSVPFEQEAGRFTYDQVTPQRAMMRGHGSHFDLEPF